MLLTITTDASYSKGTKYGAYAFQMVCNSFKYKKSGVLKQQCKDASEAEIQCILNALSVVRGEFEKIIINTDSLNAIYFLKNDLLNIDKYRLNYSKSYKKIFKKFNYKIEFRHVKAHNVVDARSYVNDWCDNSAKEKLKEFLISKELWNFQ
jgi:ribonuclease HI